MKEFLKENLGATKGRATTSLNVSEFKFAEKCNAKASLAVNPINFKLGG